MSHKHFTHALCLNTAKGNGQFVIARLDEPVGYGDPIMTHLSAPRARYRVLGVFRMDVGHALVAPLDTVVASSSSSLRIDDV